MQAHDYRKSGLSEEGMLAGMGVSVFAHVVVILLAWGISTAMPFRRVDPPLCEVHLISVQELGGGGEEGSMSQGNGGPPPEGRIEASQPAPGPQPVEPAAVQLTEVVEETVPIPQVPQEVEKPVEKPKPKPKPVARPKQKPQALAKTETPAPPSPTIGIDQPGAPESVPPGAGEGLGRGDAEGAGLHHSGRGTGGGHGPYDAAFGSGEGPRFVNKVLPRYPGFAREQGREGTVLLVVTIDERGHLVDVEVIKRAGSGFDEEAMRAVRRSTFSPAKRGGKPVLCRARLPIRFQLHGEEGN